MNHLLQHHELSFSAQFELPANGDKSAQFLILALLSGLLELPKRTGYAGQTRNYTAVPVSVQRTRTLNVIKKTIARYDLKCTPDEFIAKTLSDNRAFYHDILSEFNQYFLQSRRGAHTSAFVFLYRIVERLSYSVPLLYMSSSKDYYGTFKELKTLMADDKIGELGMFRKFLGQGAFLDQLILDRVYEIRFSEDLEIDQAYVASVRRFFNLLIPVGPSLERVGCKFLDIHDLLVTIRNRFFHTRSGDGQSNISLRSISDPDHFFSTLNPVFCSFLSIVTLQSMAKKYQKSV